MTWVSQQVLATIGAAGDAGLRFDQIAAGDSKSLENSLLKLRRRDLVELDARRYKVTAAGRAFLKAGKRFTSGPRGRQPGKRLYRNTFREHIWRAIRIKQKFSLADLLEAADTGIEADAESNAGKYVRALKRAGYLAELPTGAHGCKRYLLVRDSGPQAPRWLPKRGIVWDPNDETEHPL